MELNQLRYFQVVAKCEHMLMPAERMKYALDNGMVDFALSFENLTSERINWEPMAGVRI